MTNNSFDVLTIGNAIVDIITTCDEQFLVDEGIIKASMNLIDEGRAEHLYNATGKADGTSGGSAGNTAAGIASFGGSVAYIGKVADDQLGDVFSQDIKRIGVQFDTPALVGAEQTARSIIFVTPDSERSMNTYLGACTKLSQEDIDEAVVKSSKVTYFEGYLWDAPEAKQAIRYASELAHKSDNLVAMSLSDPFCVDRFRDEFLELLRSGTVDIVFGNESELCSLYETEDREAAVKLIQKDCNLSVITTGPHGCYVISAVEILHVPAHQVEKVVDRTGAGDLFAAGFLFAMTNGHSLETSAKYASLAAAEVIQHMGARPLVSLKEFAEANGL